MGLLRTVLTVGLIPIGAVLAYRFAAPIGSRYAQVAALRAAIEGAPKSGRWRLRARVGERVTWYAEPEEMEHRAL